MRADTAELDEAQLRAMWAGLGVVEGEAATVLATIVPPDPPPSSHRDDAADAIDRMAPAGVDLTSRLAEGGMAIVHLGHQRSLGREVAVKVLRAEVANPRTRAQLLREARLTGALEHPNIIPVHTIGLSPSGEPLLVMKRIDGISWRAFIEAPDERAETIPGRTPLDKNLDVLMQVAKAVHYAHAHGVVHRDIKPENVMIGRFGDVYVLDWGIAVRLDERHDAYPQVAGTPGYMAPEMIGSGTMSLGRHTDVYLLGAVLHDLLLGAPPHQSSTVHGAMFRAWRSTPHDYPPEVPPGLAAICKRAMAREPAERYPDADAFRQAVGEYLHRRGSIAIAAEAQARLREMAATLAGSTPDPAVVHRHYGAARFGFEHALRVWEENTAARAGLQETLERMIGFELDLGHPTAAEALFVELPVPAPALSARLARAHAEATARALELAALRAMERDLAPEVGAKARVRVALGLGAVLGGFAMGAGIFARAVMTDGVRPAHYLSHAVVLFLVAMLFIIGNRRHLLTSQLNRRISLLTLMIVGSGFLFRLAVAFTGLPFAAALPLEFVLYAVAITMMGIATHLRLAVAGVPALLGALAMTLSPAWQYEIAAVTVFAALASMAAVWQRDTRAR